MTKQPKPYSESDDHVPNPLYQSGVVDTTGTTGDLGGKIDNVSPVFAQARAAALGNAVDALDNDPDNASEVVVLPDSDLTREDAEKNLRDAAKAAETDPQLKTGQNAAQQDAALTGESHHQSEASGANKNTSGSKRSTPAKKAPAKKAAGANKTSGPTT